MKHFGGWGSRIGKKVRLLGAVLVAAALLAACQSAPAAAPTAAPKAAAKEVTVKIGHLPDYTGAIAAVGQNYGKGTTDYFQWVNDQGGLAYKDPKSGETAHAKLDVLWDDTGYDANRALNAYQRQKQAGVVAVIGHGGVVATALAEAASKDKIPMLIAASPSDATLKATPRYLVTSTNVYNQYLMAFVKYIKGTWKESRAPRLGLTYMQGAPTALAGIAGVPEYAQKMGWEVSPSEAIAEPATDTSIQVNRLLATKPDYVYYIGTAQGFSVMVKDATRLGVRGQTQFVLVGPAYDTSVLQKLADAETDGILTWYYTALPNELNQPGVKLADTIVKKYQTFPLNTQYLDAIGLAHVLTGGLKAALEKVGGDAITSEAVRAGLFGLKGLDIGGIYGPVTITEDRPWASGQARLIQWKDHKDVVLSDWQEGQP